MPGATRMTFDFYTPVETINQDLWMDSPARDRMLDKLIALKRVYRDFIVLPERASELMKPRNSRSVTDNCLFAKKSFAFGPQGELKQKCMTGRKADCDRCGCVVPFYMASLVDRKRIVEDSARSLAGWPVRGTRSRPGAADGARAHRGKSSCPAGRAYQ